MHGIGLNGIWISVDVCVRAVCVFLVYMCVHTCRCAVSAYLQFLYLITDMYVLLEFLDRGTLPLQSPFNTRRSMRTHTQAHHTSYRWHTHVTTATRYSWRHATDREGETTILADQSFSKSRATGIAYYFFFFQIFFSWEPKNFIFIISSSTWRCIFTLTLFLPHGTHIDWFNLECSLSKPSSSKWCDVSFMCHHDRFTRWCNLTTDMVRLENKEGNKLFCLFVVNIKCTL